MRDIARFNKIFQVTAQLATIAALGLTCASAHASATAVLMTQQAQQKKAEASVTSNSPQTCAPAGYVVTTADGGRTRDAAIVKNGELQYCVVKADSSWLRPECKTYLPAEEFVRVKSGRQDAVYSGMAVRGSPIDSIVLFYCLPKR